jgi:predicted Zn-dependent peptidase
MNRIGKSELCWGEQMSVDDMLSRIAAVTPDEVRSVARDILGRRPSLSVIGPLKDKQAARLHDAVA